MHIYAELHCIGQENFWDVFNILLETRPDLVQKSIEMHVYYPKLCKNMVFGFSSLAAIYNILWLEKSKI